jgi:hypothetical protein
MLVGIPVFLGAACLGGPGRGLVEGRGQVGGPCWLRSMHRAFWPWQDHDGCLPLAPSLGTSVLVGCARALFLSVGLDRLGMPSPHWGLVLGILCNVRCMRYGRSSHTCRRLACHRGYWTWGQPSCLLTSKFHMCIPRVGGRSGSIQWAACWGLGGSLPHGSVGVSILPDEKVPILPDTASGGASRVASCVCVVALSWGCIAKGARLQRGPCAIPGLILP